MRSERFPKPSIDEINRLFPGMGFRTMQEIGRGSTAVVYEVSDGNQCYALKVGQKTIAVRPHEINMLKAVGDYIAHKITDNNGYLLMKRKSGICLEHQIFIKKDQDIPPEKIAFQVLYAIFQLHKRRIIHHELNAGAAMYDTDTDSVSFVDFAGAVFMGDEIMVTRQDPNRNVRRRLPYTYQSDLTTASECILQHLNIQDEDLRAITESMRRGPLDTRPSIQMALLKFYMEARKKGIAVTNENQNFPSEEGCVLIYKLLEALRDYQSYVLKTMQSSFLGISIRHKSKSAVVAMQLADDLISCASRDEVMVQLQKFIREYAGSNRPHSLKVLLASKYLDRKVPDEEISRIEMVNKFEAEINSTASLECKSD